MDHHAPVADSAVSPAAAPTTTPTAAPVADALVAADGVLHGGPPDWSQITDDIDCPLCGYLLRGLIEPRCPECGYRFDWAALLAARVGRHPYLFEHHPERNAWSYWRTFIGALRPRRFWSELHPAQRQVGRRLLIYAAVPYVLMIAIWMPLLAIDVGMTYRTTNAWATTMRAQQRMFLSAHSNDAWVQQIASQPGGITAYLDQNFPASTVADALKIAFSLGPFGIHLLASLLFLPLWSVATLAALLIFQVSMHRAKLRTIHAARCVTYSFDLLAWLLLLTICVSAVLRPFGMTLDAASWMEDALSSVLALRYGATTNRAMILRGIGMTPPSPLSAYVSAAAACVLTLVCLFCAVRLTIAYRRYLNFHAPVAVIAASQVIVFLAGLVMLVQVIM